MRFRRGTGNRRFCNCNEQAPQRKRGKPAIGAIVDQLISCRAAPSNRCPATAMLRVMGRHGRVKPPVPAPVERRAYLLRLARPPMACPMLGLPVRVFAVSKRFAVVNT